MIVASLHLFLFVCFLCFAFFEIKFLCFVHHHLSYFVTTDADAIFSKSSFAFRDLYNSHTKCHSDNEKFGPIETVS